MKFFYRSSKTKPFNLALVSCCFTYLLSGCQVAHSQSKQGAQKAMEKIETVFDVSLHLNVIKFDVLSTGCTRAKDFKLNVAPVKDNTLEVSLVRLKPDYCRAMPKVVEVAMKLPQMNNDKSTKVVVKNPLSMKRPGKKKLGKFDKPK